MVQYDFMPMPLSPRSTDQSLDATSRLDDEIAMTTAVAETQRWLERAVIGLNLCPFAKAVYVKGQIHYAVSHAQTPDALLIDLAVEMKNLQTADAANRDTTLLIAPWCLPEFLDFNAFLDQADHLLNDLDLVGIFQIASFHPQYEFADAPPGDVSHFTNRAPYPMLHLLREDSVARAVDAFPEADAIYGKNMATLRALGLAGWMALDVGGRLSGDNKTVKLGKFGNSGR